MLLALPRGTVVSVTTAYAAPAQAKPFLVSKDGHATLMAVTLAGDLHAAQTSVGGVLRGRPRRRRARWLRGSDDRRGRLGFRGQ